MGTGARGEACGERGVGAFVARWRDVFLRVSMMPLVFLGVGVYRAWIATFFRFGAYPGITFTDYAIFEACIGLASFACAALARRIAPLWSNRRVLGVTVALTTLGSALIVLASLALALPAPAAATAVKVVGLVLAGAGVGVLILLWCEFYGALNPMRVAVFHALSIAFGELLIWLFMGLRAEWIVAFSLLLPAVSVGCAHRSELKLLESERPGGFGPMVRGGVLAGVRRGASHGLEGAAPAAAGQPRADGAATPAANSTDASMIPWKAIALMATCTFAMQYGTFPGQPVVAGNVLGVLFSTAFVFFGVLSNSRWFNFDTIYRVAFPAITAVCMLAAPLIGDNQLATWCYDAGYTMLSMYIMIVLSNITYRFGINAVWLNGIERGIRYVIETAGWATYMLTASFLSGGAAFVVQMVITVAVIVVFLVIVGSEKELSANWGITLREPGATGDDILPGAAALSTGQLSMRVSELSAECGLSDREEEVLQLMARRTPMREMEKSLFVAQGTIKAHTSRIYRKLGVHSRAELFAMLGVPEEGREAAQ
ncbi:MAG: LuxR C-terminal-related transcriptional regulator [Coriobacteriales bacterium]|jgi:DNA-binding CsgD family transcriptional regulator